MVSPLCYKNSNAPLRDETKKTILNIGDFKKPIIMIYTRRGNDSEDKKR